MDEAQLQSILEAALFAAGEPLSVERMQELFGEGEAPDKEAIRSAVEGLRGQWEGRGLELAEVASGFRFQVRQSFAPWVSRLWEERPPRYSRALLETLALIAYRQPITRAEIEDIRGVTVSSNIIKTLQEREWIRVVGHRDVPGKPAMYATTRQFLDYFNLKSLDDLPPLAELRDIDQIDRELDLQLPAVGAAPAIEEEEAAQEGPPAETLPLEDLPSDEAGATAAALDENDVGAAARASAAETPGAPADASADDEAEQTPGPQVQPGESELVEAEGAGEAPADPTAAAPARAAEDARAEDAAVESPRATGEPPRRTPEPSLEE